MSKGSGSGAVDLGLQAVDGCEISLGWEVADGAEGDSLKVVDCLG
jgi:hypothetical protein